MGERLVTVATFANPVETHVARSCLEASGLKAFLTDEETASMVWYLTNALGGIKLQVGEQDADEALALLAESAGTASPSADQPEAMPSPPTEAAQPRALNGAEPGEPESVLTEREQNADRALRGAVFGLLLLPLQLYVFWLLLKVFFSEERLGPDQRWRAVIAALMNLPLMVCLLFWMIG